MNVLVRHLASAAIGLSLGACATITRGTTTTFNVETTPPGAKVKTSSGYTCPSTPCTFKMARKAPFDVTASLSGYKTKSAHVDSRVAGAGGAGMAGNILLGGIIGVGVDATSGALNDLYPNPLRMTLEPEVVAEVAKPPEGAAPEAVKEAVQ